jgi:hypothetical protein
MKKFPLKKLKKEGISFFGDFFNNKKMKQKNKF